MEIREKSFSKFFIFFVFLVFIIFFILQVIGPLALPKDSVDDLSGLTVFSDNENEIDKMPFPYNLVYSAGDKLCHQKADRSFFINENQMPFCARCTAIWLGIAAGIFFMIFFEIKLSEKIFFMILIGLIPLGIDGVGQLIGLWESTNIIRFLTGLLTGVVSGIALGVIIDELSGIISKKDT